jgi:hypothetical protein
MRTGYIFCFALFLSGLLQGCSTGNHHSSENLQPAPLNNSAHKDLNEEIKEVLLQWQKIQPGMTRADLLKTFTGEGGLYTAKHRTFGYRQCWEIKVDVDFDLSNPGQSVVDQQPTDIIKRISKPYLEWGTID